MQEHPTPPNECRSFRKKQKGSFIPIKQKEQPADPANRRCELSFILCVSFIFDRLENIP